MPRQQQSRQQPINSFSTSSDSSTSYLSAKPKSHSPRSNFNPFSPLSPHPPDKELEDSDQDDDDGAIFSMEHNRPTGPRLVYSRAKLLDVARDCRKQGWVKPKGMGSLESWYGTPSLAQDPAIASMGSAPNRRTGGGAGFGEGFGYGGGIGGKGLSRGGRHNGPRRNDHEGSTHGPLHGPSQSVGSSRDLSGGPMGKFAVKSTPDRMKIGADENKKPKDDWRRNQPPHQAQRGDTRHWNTRQEEDNAEPEWMDDQPDHDPAISAVQGDHAFGAGDDIIAAQKQGMRAGGSSDRKPLVGFFATEKTPTPVQTPIKPIKEYNAANYLLPAKIRQQVESETAPVREPPNASRFARFFGNPAHSDEPVSTRVSVAPRPVTSPVITSPPNASPALPPMTSKLPDRTTALMAMLTPGHRASSSQSPAAPSPPPAIPYPPGGFMQMQPPAGYGSMQTSMGHDSRSMPQYYPGQAPPPLQQYSYGPPPPQLYHTQQQGFLPPHMSGGQPAYLHAPPPPPPGFSHAPEQHHFYAGGQGQLPIQQQQPRDATQQERNMHALLSQWQHQHPQ